MTHRRVLVLGGARSGKSAYAEALLAHHPAVDYVATAALDPDDVDWAARIARHRARRPSGWATVETDDLAAVFVASASPALIDSVTTWLARLMDSYGIWTPKPDADAALAAALDRTVEAWAGAPREVIAVSDEVGSGIVPESASGRRFRDELGLLNQRLAVAADEVWLVTAGLPLRLR